MKVMVLDGRVRELDKVGCDAADEAADFGRRESDMLSLMLVVICPEFVGAGILSVLIFVVSSLPSPGLLSSMTGVMVHAGVGAEGDNGTEVGDEGVHWVGGSGPGRKRIRLNRKTPAHLVGHSLQSRPRVWKRLHCVGWLLPWSLITPMFGLMVVLSLIRSLAFLLLVLVSLLTSLSLSGMIGSGVMLIMFA